MAVFIMRILMLSWEYPPRIVGGISRVVYDLAQTIAKKGNEVHVVTCMESNAKEAELDKHVIVHRVHTYEINTANFIDWVLQLNFALLERVIKLINETGKFDLVHAHDWIVAFTAKTIKYSYSIPLISTIHATEFGRNGGLHNETQKYISSVEWFLTYESWKVIVNSDFMKLEVQNVFQLPEDKIFTLPNGVEIDKFKGVERDYSYRRQFAEDHEKIVFFVGRIVNEKGVHILIDSFPKILQEYPNVKLVIAGKGPQLDFLKWKVWNKDIVKHVHFTGYIDDSDLMKLYKCADIAVFPSLYEPFGIVVLEAIVAGASVVVSETGGLSRIIEHEKEGLKALVGNSDSFAHNILRLLQEPELAQDMKQNALFKVTHEFNWETIADKTIELYKVVTDEANAKQWVTPSIQDLMRKNQQE